MHDFKWPDGMFSNSSSCKIYKTYTIEHMVVCVVVSAVLGLFFGVALTFTYMLGL